MISLLVMTPNGTVVKGMPATSLCTGIRRIVSSQSPSSSVRERSSTSAMSSKMIREHLRSLSENQNHQRQGILHLPSCLEAILSCLPDRLHHNKDNLSSYCLLSLWSEKRQLRKIVSSGVNKLIYTFANRNHPY